MKSPARRFAAVAIMSATIMGCGKGAWREPRGFDELMERARAEYHWNNYAVVYAESAAKVPGATPAELMKAYRLGADIRAYIGDQAGAQRKLEQALALDPSDPDTLTQLAENNREKPRQALAYAERAVRAAGGATAPRKAAITRLWGEILIDTGDDEGARRELRAALALAPEDLETLRLLARLERG
ncbi:MAG: tetratricopeptide repeat protein, partial [Elusimicrobiota bacterium]